MIDLLTSVDIEDPVREPFHLTPSKKRRVWCDSSSLALGVAVDIGVRLESKQHGYGRGMMLVTSLS